MPASLVDHYDTVAKAIIDGRVVPFLGAGANLCSRPEGAGWEKGRYLPSGAELSQYLATELSYPEKDRGDLLRVSEYLSLAVGSGPLYGKLRALFGADYPTTPLHEFLASVPAALRSRGIENPHLLVVTTNYDGLMENAFRAAGEPVDVVSYVAIGDSKGKFLHWKHGETEPRLIEIANQYSDLSLAARSIILKIHGTVDKRPEERDSFVITEDNYIDYLTRTDIAGLVPSILVAKLKRSHLLFLGYALRDWNLRVILHRMWGEQPLSWKSWAVQKGPSAIDREFWRKRDVEIVDQPLVEYVRELRERLSPPVSTSGGPG